jgi:hypothetical protein
MTFPYNRDFVSKAFAPHLPQREIRRRISLQFVCFLLFSSFLVAPPKVLFAGHKPKTDKFKGYVVAAGPKSITVKDKKNIYHVRSFNYSPKVEQQLMKKKLEPGMTVTVHYTRGTDIAVKLN